MRAVVFLLVLVFVAGCASSSEKTGSPPRRPGMDTLCYNDCLGAGTSKEFCEVRCSY